MSVEKLHSFSLLYSQVINKNQRNVLLIISEI